ncbi:hypothetical protein DY000_02044515 [Brassica cretica]|uniref:Uncharacterized protein n=1 Tax=Brassica cretica TaxID=69181 RepID=A0ABQ7F7N6_BRACR|nr:hypothetical protein DY000_02044515 [Brassica cretica]
MISPSPECMVKRRCLLLPSTAPACTRASSWTRSQGLVRASLLQLDLLLSVIALVFKELHSPSVLHFPSSKLQQILFCLLDVSAASFVSPSRMGSCIDRMRVTVTCAFHFQRRLLRFSVWFSAELAWARLLASSSSCGAPERELAASIDVCLSHFGECLTEPGSSYSLDGLVNLNCYEALGMEV